jgi:cytoskeletal protein RodZ
VKEKRTYKRFDLLAVIAILGCIGVLLFECFFIFELYDRVPLRPETSVPARPAPKVKVPAVSDAPAVEKSVVPETNAPPVTPVTNAAPSAETEKVPVGHEFVEPVAVPAG